jgi:hypothetical protein
VFVAFGIQRAMRMRRIICGLRNSKMLFHISKKGKIFRKKKIIEHKVCVLIFFTTFV